MRLKLPQFAPVKKCNNFDIIQEIIYKIYRKNKSVTITEIPYVFKKRLYGETKRNLIRFVFTYSVTLLRLFLYDLRSHKNK